ncbi:MAG: glycosyltransferase family 39 protein, partial [Pseudohongiella sp.]
MPQTETISIARTVGILCLLAILTTAIKLFLAIRLELYSDEIFYWQASQFPALAYSDLPFMAALLAGLGAELFGHHAIAVRSMFLLMGCSTPALVYWLARPLTGHRHALISAMLTFCLPMAAFLGLLAVPDVPLIFWGLLFLGCLERATRCGHWHWWLLAGAFAALGLSTHYRFSLYVLAALIFMFVSRSHWYYWRSARLWVSGLIAMSGLYPALSFNLVHDLSGIDYHLLSRHPWQFQLEGLLHPVIQGTIVTPLMYATLWLTLWILLKKAREGDTRAGLFAAFAATNLGVYLLLAPWSDTTRTTLHWPLSGYLPLLVYAPLALSAAGGWLTGRYHEKRSRFVVGAIPVTGLIGTLLLFVGIGSQGFNQQLQAYFGVGVLSNKMAGWQPLMNHLKALQERYDIPADGVVVTDNYYTSAQIEFAIDDARTYTIDQDKTVRDGRYAQYAIWQKDEAGLRQLPGEQAVFITEDSALSVDEKLAVMDR